LNNKGNLMKNERMKRSKLAEKASKYLIQSLSSSYDDMISQLKNNSNDNELDEDLIKLSWEIDITNNSISIVNGYIDWLFCKIYKTYIFLKPKDQIQTVVDFPDCDENDINNICTKYYLDKNKLLLIIQWFKSSNYLELPFLGKKSNNKIYIDLIKINKTAPYFDWFKN